MLYLTYSEGFKSGGFEMKGLELTQFEPESVVNYEIGMKIDALDERLRFNTAFYYMDYEDIQIRITEQGRTFADILLYIDNAGAATIKGQLVNMRDGGFISEHDFHIASLIAGVVTGGDVDAGTLVTEEYLMTLERKAFCSLILHPKTQERIMGMLSTGKPVRN